MGVKIKVNKFTDKNDSCVALLIGATSEEVVQLRKSLPGWLCIEAPEGWPFTKESKPTAQSFRTIIVFAGRDGEMRALNVCKYICEQNMMDGVPLLVAADRYQMSLANEVRRLPRGNFIFKPIDEAALLGRIEATQGKEL
ncbi:MAG: hypothetical protein PVH77_03690 [Phycisphaerales bacterium]|jgi:hypothetical protein